MPVIREFDKVCPATGEWCAPCGADSGEYSLESNPIVWSRLVTGDARICSNWEQKSTPVCLYPLCTVREHKAGAGISVKICVAHALAILP